MMISTEKPRRLTFTCFKTAKQAAKWLNKDNNLDKMHSIVKHHGLVIVNHYERVTS